MFKAATFLLWSLLYDVFMTLYFLFFVVAFFCYDVYFKYILQFQFVLFLSS